MRIYNSFGRKLEEFVPLDKNTVKMYVCGPTVYDYVHLGHGRTFVAFDAITRFLRLKGFNVIRVQNITDIDDKIINKANETGKPWQEIVDIYSKDYLENLKALKVKIDFHPRVSSHIKEIIQFIQSLIDKGHAYTAESGSVYFDVTTYPKYGELSSTKMDQWNQGEEFLKEKKHPFDFALWKGMKPGEPYWESPWGNGRPGWHIECSTMSTRYLGEQFDIHGGGMDLIFPHHENERAQSESLTGKKWVNYWIHVAFLNIKGEKMAKSLKNIIPLNEAIKKYGTENLRYWFLSSNYRSPINFSEDIIEQSSRSLQRLKDAVSILRSILDEEPKSYSSDDEIATQREIIDKINGFFNSLENDFDTSSALAYIHELAGIVFSKLQSSRDFLGASLALDGFSKFNEVFGVMDEEMGFTMEKVDKVIDKVIEVRDLLRSRKMYDLSDQIRKILEESGIKLLDSKDKTTWRFQ
ncbi:MULTISPECIES: cysteine--tRNA ligase [Acidianus]|uniref:Cysteine--tRNA ligase n=1 Tax=Candidatus Acidianus copahuensis TaxID=1160895 RepID=A0A031LLH9_9CREN|nr:MULTISPECIES: cysteine--tRNA ligase [Acidianus]EZQ02094.1 cysteinyl-tRNA synthetase [Candidatus Acidianus copahuensis]NON63477.1 cysteine--tRNA ligase [Acidianus sp. RZ1]